MTEVIQAVVPSIVVVGVLTDCALLHALCSLKAAWINVIVV